MNTSNTIDVRFIPTLSASACRFYCGTAGKHVQSIPSHGDPWPDLRKRPSCMRSKASEPRSQGTKTCGRPARRTPHLQSRKWNDTLGGAQNFESVQLANITPITIWFLGDISIHHGVYKPI